MGRTILEYCGESSGNSCGYCRNRKCKEEKRETNSVDYLEEAESVVEKGASKSLGLWAHSLSSHYYLSLMDMGWRRSGKYLYKPANETTCCPQYTIRLDVTKFVLSRSQKRTLRQMNEYLISGTKPRCCVREDDQRNEAKKERIKEVVKEKVKREDRSIIKKKEMRRRRFEEKCRIKNLDIGDEKNKRLLKEESRRRTIESYIMENSDSNKYKFEVKLVSVNSEEFQTRDRESFDLYKKYQTLIHKDKDSSFASFRRFLCDSPIDEEKDSTGRVTFGSYHLWFLLDNKLIAVSVIDILPRCYSAKYMFYDPDYSFLSLGTFTALREIEFTRKFFAMNPEIRWYYMGYYIDTCPKMRYKAKFRPSDLLCDKSFTWLDFEDCKPLFAQSSESNGYTVFRPDKVAPTSSPIGDMLVFSNKQIISYQYFIARNPNFEKRDEVETKLEELARKVGPNIPNAIYYFNELN